MPWINVLAEWKRAHGNGTGYNCGACRQYSDENFKWIDSIATLDPWMTSRTIRYILSPNEKSPHKNKHLRQVRARSLSLLRMLWQSYSISVAGAGCSLVMTHRRVGKTPLALWDMRDPFGLVAEP